MRCNRFVVSWVCFLLLADLAEATPRYAARYGQRCALCHVLPTGGGTRTLYASQMIVPEELSFTRYEPDRIAAIRPDLTPAVTVGLDLRNLAMLAEGGRADQITMQAAVHLAIEMDPRFAAVVSTGEGGVQEYAGIAYVLPASGYAKVGRFTPDFGWRWEDHLMATRRYLLSESGLTDPGQLLRTGIEVGMHGRGIEVTGSFLDDLDPEVASYAGRAVARRSFGGLNLALGSSILRDERGAGRHAAAVAGFGYAAMGPLSWVGEVDLTDSHEREGVLIAQELGILLHRGLTLRAIHSFQDPDRHLETGTRQRWGAGLDLLATPWFGAIAMLNRYENGGGDLVPDSDTWRGELVLHVLY